MILLTVAVKMRHCITKIGECKQERGAVVAENAGIEPEALAGSHRFPSEP